MRCLWIAPGTTPADFRQSESLFTSAFRGPLEQAGVQVQTARKVASPSTTAGTPAQEVAGCDFVLAEVTRADPVVFFYLGLAHSHGKPIVTLRRDQGPEPTPLLRYSDFHTAYELSPEGRTELNLALQGVLADLERVESAEMAAVDPEAVLDWGRLDADAHRDLCLELLMLEPRLAAIRPLEGMASVAFVGSGRTADDRPSTWLVAVGGGLTGQTDVAALVHDVDALRSSLQAPVQGARAVHLLFVATAGDRHPVAVDADRVAELGIVLRGTLDDAPVELTTEVWGREELERRIAAHPSLTGRYFLREHAVPAHARPLDLYRDAVVTLDELFTRAGSDATPAAGGDGSEWQNLAFTATHSIGNSLFPIETYLMALQEIVADARLEDGVEAAAKALENVERAKTQIERFKAISATREPSCDVVSMVERLAAPLDFVASRGMEVVRFGDDDATVWADPLMIDEILDELVTNALSWMQGSGRLTVTLQAAAADALPDRLAAAMRPFVRLRVEDDGPGVSHEDKEKIFELFFSRSPQGKGIGLSVCRKYLRELGGEIVETGTPGVGARFDLFIPRPTGQESR